MTIESYGRGSLNGCNDMIQSTTISNENNASWAITAAIANNKRGSSIRSSKGTKNPAASAAFYSMRTQQDDEIEDGLAQVQKTLRDLKTSISTQSKTNFLLERDVRFLDSRIALLIQNRMALDENEFAAHLTESDDTVHHQLDNKKLQQYGSLFFLLQNEPRYIASLCRLVNLSEIDTLLQTVMFTLYGNQYESREENLLLTMFQNVLAAQFESTVEFGSLLRANTPVSRMLTTYTRRGPGQSYLKSVLSEKIAQLMEQDELNLQINPLKVYDEIVNRMECEGTLPPGFKKSVTPDVAEANLEVQVIIQPRLEQLTAIANDFLTTIINSLDETPYGIRWVCKQIRSLTKRKYADASESAISSLIGGFFFLRFVNPAIVTPQAYMLIEGNPSSNTRVALTFIAKLLQNLANKPTYAKEAYMIPTNSFINENKARVNKFLHDLCEVGDFYESLEMGQYMVLSRKDITINITPNELFSTHSLLNQHIDTLAPDTSHHIRTLLNDLGESPSQLPRKNNQPLQLPLSNSRWELEGNEESEEEGAASGITQNDIKYMETKSLFVQIIRSLPLTMKRCQAPGDNTMDLIVISEAAGTAKDSQLVSKGMKVKSLLKELEEANIVTRKNNYELLVQEIKQELIHLGDLKERAEIEVESLEQVFKTIQDHNNYLQGQLESYRAYLKNVRLQIGGGNIRSNNGTISSALTRSTSRLYQLSNNSNIDTTTDDSNISQKLPSPRATVPSTIITNMNHNEPNNATANGKKKSPTNGSQKFTYQQLEKDGVIVESEVPEHRRPNIYLMIQSQVNSTFIISLHFKGREKPILEVDLKLDDLLEKQKDRVESIDLEYLKLSVSKLLQLLNKSLKAKPTR